MSEQLNFTNTHSQARAKAIKVASEVVGMPDDYQQTYETKGKPIQAKGIRGAFGSTDAGDSSKITANTFPDALISVADYIVTGKIE